MHLDYCSHGQILIRSMCSRCGAIEKSLYDLLTLLAEYADEIWSAEPVRVPGHIPV